MTEILIENFSKSVQEFLAAAVEVWPEEKQLAQFKADYPSVDTASLFAEFEVQFKPYYGRLMEKDASVLEEDIPFFKVFDVKGLYAGAHNDVRETSWQYVKQIVQHASVQSIYAKCPKDMMAQVSSLASSIVSEMESGNLDMKNLDPMELSRKMMSVVSKEDIETWGKQISMDGSMQGMMTMMQMAMSTMGLPDPSGAASGGGGAGSAGPSGPNISSMLSMLSGAGGGLNPAALLGAMGDNSNPLAALMQNLDIGELMKMLPKK
jgi:hypothetical protein